MEHNAYNELTAAYALDALDAHEREDYEAHLAQCESCRAELAGYKQPKAIRFLAYEAFPRSASGKVQRHELERLLDDDEGGTT